MECVSVRLDGRLYYPYDGVILGATIDYDAFLQMFVLTIKLKVEGIPESETTITGYNGHRGFSVAEFFQFRVQSFLEALGVNSLEVLRKHAFRAYLLYSDGCDGPMPVAGYGMFDGSPPFIVSSTFRVFAERAARTPV